MPFHMVPTFADVTVAVADRTEARAVVANDDHHYEAATYPVVDLGYMQRRFRLDLLYLPSFTVLPLERQPRTFLALHTFGTSTSYTWRRTSIAFNQALSFGEQNFAVLATAGSTPPIGAPTTGTSSPSTGNNSSSSDNSSSSGSGSSQPSSGMTTPNPGTATGVAGGGPSTGPVVGPGGITSTPTSGATTNIPQGSLGINLKIISYTANAGVTQRLSRATTLGVGAGYILTGGREESREQLPLVQGPLASATLTQRLSLADSVAGIVTTQYSWSSLGIRTVVNNVTGSWSHAFDVMTSTLFSAGLNVSRLSRDDGLVEYGVFPTFTASLNHVRPLHPGSVSLGLYASAAPALDFETLVVDPRISFGGSAGYGLDRFFAFANIGSSLSMSGQTSGSFSGASGAAGISYVLGPAAALSGGIRGAYQNYQNQTVLPFTYVGYVGITVALSDKL